MDQPPPILETPPPPAVLREQTMSLPARLMNVFAVPGDVFEEVKTTRFQHVNWLVPALLGWGVSAVAAMLLLSQPAIQQQFREQQEQKMEQQVQAGKKTREQADQEMAVLEKFSGPTTMKVFTAAGMVFYGFGRVFWWALVLWLIGVWLLKVRFSYAKAMEVAGLAGMIGVLGMLVTFLLQVNLGNAESSPSLALAVREVDPKNPGHLALAAVNLFDVWQVGVMASGLARLAGAPFVRALLPLIVFWLLMSFALGTLSAFATRLGG